jgi:hypothetical protein
MLTKADLVEALTVSLLEDGTAPLCYAARFGDTVTVDGEVRPDRVIDAILRTIAEKTESPRTCEEITRVLNDGQA